MNKKVEKKISETTLKILNNVNNSLEGIKGTTRGGEKITAKLPEETIKKIHKGYLKFLNTLFNIITGLVVSGTFLWFLPIYLKLGWERTTTIVLVVILLYIKYAKIRVTTE